MILRQTSRPDHGAGSPRNTRTKTQTRERRSSHHKQDDKKKRKGGGSCRFLLAAPSVERSHEPRQVRQVRHEMAAQRTVRPHEPDAGYRAAVSPRVRRPGKKCSTVDLDQNGKAPPISAMGQGTNDTLNPRGCALGGTAPTGPEMGSWNGRRIFTVLHSSSAQ